MRLLIFTQVVDKNHPTLGFFHGWLVGLALQYESIQVICLEEGEHALPKNISVYSLGKERVKDAQGEKKVFKKFTYIQEFYSLLGKLSGTYDAVFVHMNQEYVLLGGLYWKIRNIPVYMWRNHPYGNMQTRIAVAFSKKVFATSTQSFTAQYKKTVLMPAGVDTKLFVPVEGILRSKYSVCIVGRIGEVKRIHLALEAIAHLVVLGSQISCTIVGSPGSKVEDKAYFDFLLSYVESQNIASSVHFIRAVSPDKLPAIYSAHEVCLNLTRDGSFDKTILEAAACGAIPLVSNTSLRGILPDSCITEPTRESISENLAHIFEPKVELEVRDPLKKLVDSHSLEKLVQKLVAEIQ